MVFEGLFCSNARKCQDKSSDSLWGVSEKRGRSPLSPLAKRSKGNAEFRLMSRFVSETANVLELVQDTLRPNSFEEYVNHLFD